MILALLCLAAMVASILILVIVEAIAENRRATRGDARDETRSLFSCRPSITSSSGWGSDPAMPRADSTRRTAR